MGAPRESGGGGGLSLKELVIAAGSSAAAFLIVPLFWENGTLFATAMTPVIVAIVRELLARPVEKVGEVGQKLGAVAPAARVPRRRRAARAARPSGSSDPFGLRAPERRRVLARRALRLGLVTGLVAFVAVAAVVTLSEVTVFGKSFGGGAAERPSLVPGGSASDTADEQEAQPGEDVAPDATADPDATQPPEATEAPSEEATPAPTPGASPAPEGTPVPAPAPTVAPAPPGETAPAPAPAP